MRSTKAERCSKMISVRQNAAEVAERRNGKRAKGTSKSASFDGWTAFGFVVNSRLNAARRGGGGGEMSVQSIF
jgi:hypothetical protein